MSKRNSKVAKAARRAGREAARANLHTPEPLVTVRSFGELVDAAEHGETLPCGCNAHELLHGDGWEEIGAEEDGETVLSITPEAWERIVDVPGLEAAILEAVEAGGADAVVALLAPYGIRPGDGLVVAEPG